MKNLVKGNLRTVLGVPIYLVTAADFRQYAARGRACLGVERRENWEKKMKKGEFCLEKKLVSRTLGKLVFIYLRLLLTRCPTILTP